MAMDVHEYEATPATMIGIGVPTFGMVSIRWHMCMLGLGMPMNLPSTLFSVIGREIGAARNEIVQRALAFEHPKTKARISHLMFVDDDCLLSTSAVRQLYEHRKPIMAGLYYTKSCPSEPLILTTKHGGVAHGFTHGDVIPCYAHGMGCTLIDLEVFRQMFARGVVELTDIACHQCEGRAAGCRGCFGTGKVIRWFYTTQGHVAVDADGPEFRYQTEDAYFCERALLAGYQPCVDTGVFAFHYDKDRGEAYPLDQWRQYRAGQPIAWPEQVPA